MWVDNGRTRLCTSPCCVRGQPGVRRSPVPRRRRVPRTSLAGAAIGLGVCRGEGQWQPVGGERTTDVVDLDADASGWRQTVQRLTAWEWRTARRGLNRPSHRAGYALPPSTGPSTADGCPRSQKRSSPSPMPSTGTLFNGPVAETNQFAREYGIAYRIGPATGPAAVVPIPGTPYHADEPPGRPTTAPADVGSRWFPCGERSW